MRYHHIIWDWNGTLLDDAWLCVEVMNITLTTRGMPPVTLEDYAALFRFPVKDYYAEIGFDFAREPFEILSTEFITGYEARKVECRLRPGVRQALTALASQRVPQTIISASHQPTLDEMLAHHQLANYFAAARGLEDHHAHGKTAIAQAWLAEQGADPAGMLFIGDTAHDVEVAQAIGVQAVLVYSGHQSRARLEATGVPVFNSLTDVLNYAHRD